MGNEYVEVNDQSHIRSKPIELYIGIIGNEGNEGIGPL
jgi:hypothetical protein